MASYHAISATCDAVIRLLRQSWDQDTLFNQAALDFQVYHTIQFQQRPIQTGISLYLYNVAVNTTQRIPPGRPRADGTPRPPQLPLDLYFMLTPWAEGASLQQEILGWMMHTIEDNPVLSTALLNTTTAQVFGPDETVEIVSGYLTNEDLLRLWDAIPGDFQISVPYIARVVRIDSERDAIRGEPVLTRELDFGQKA
ncbi:MAG: hypothetical protein CL610_02740 [Anaerolineaceae bacterium]|nr:hypothetical protein [Anaerolineaceae bacterium]